MKIYRLVAALISWTALLLQFYLITQGQSGAGWFAAATNYMSFFTIQSTVLCAVAFTLFWVAAPVVRGAIALYVTATMIIYQVALAHLWAPMGAQLVADVALHYVVPILYLIDWILFARKAPLRPRHALVWLIYPLIFGLYTLARGQLTGWYPYPFLDLSMHSYGAVLMNSMFIAIGFVLLGVLLVSVGWVIGRVAGEPEMSGHNHMPRRPHMSH